MMDPFVKNLVYGLKNPCMEKNIWVLNVQLFYLTTDLKLIKIWRNVKVKGHVEEVLSFIKNLD